jgi:hypothetical protein
LKVDISKRFTLNIFVCIPYLSHLHHTVTWISLQNYLYKLHNFHEVTYSYFIVEWEQCLLTQWLGSESWQEFCHYVPLRFHNMVLRYSVTLSLTSSLLGANKLHFRFSNGSVWRWLVFWMLCCVVW